MLSISIVTPSYNQAEFLPACIESVRGQTVPALEHLVFDPGSNDGSREIAGAAESVELIAEPDSGQADAIAKGMLRSRGQVIGWLNSDDIYVGTDTFEKVIARFEAKDRPDIVYGRGIYIDPDGNRIRDAYVNEDPSTLGTRLHHEVGILQPTVFFRDWVFKVIEPPLEHLHFGMDYDLWIRAVDAGLRFAFLPETLAAGRYYLDNKTMGSRGDSYQEVLNITSSHFGAIHVRWAQRLAEHRLGNADGILDDGSSVDPKLRDEETAHILAVHNYPWSCRDTLKNCHQVRPYTETIEFMRAHSLSLDHHAKPVKDGAPVAGHRTYVVDGTTWSFERRWVESQLEKTETKLRQLGSQRTSDTCVIAGNGPSLNATDWNLLDNYDVFASNFAHLKAELFDRTTYLSVVNNLVAEQGASVFNEISGVTKFAPWWLSYCLAPSDEMVFLPSVGHPEFSTDPMSNVSWRHTVSFFAMQLAYGLGYRRVGLIGFDHSYRQDAARSEGETISQRGDDENHFDPNYFKAKRWHAADVDNMEAMYRLADQAFRADNREIINCTTGGHLEIFPRMSLDALPAA